MRITSSGSVPMKLRDGQDAERRRVGVNPELLPAVHLHPRSSSHHGKPRSLRLPRALTQAKPGALSSPVARDALGALDTLEQKRVAAAAHLEEGTQRGLHVGHHFAAQGMSDWPPQARGLRLAKWGPSRGRLVTTPRVTAATLSSPEHRSGRERGPILRTSLADLRDGRLDATLRKGRDGMRLGCHGAGRVLRRPRSRPNRALLNSQYLDRTSARRLFACPGACDLRQCPVEGNRAGHRAEPGWRDRSRRMARIRKSVHNQSLPVRWVATSQRRRCHSPLATTTPSEASGHATTMTRAPSPVVANAAWLTARSSRNRPSSGTSQGFESDAGRKPD